MLTKTKTKSTSLLKLKVNDITKTTLHNTTCVYVSKATRNKCSLAWPDPMRKIPNATDRRNTCSKPMLLCGKISEEIQSAELQKHPCHIQKPKYVLKYHTPKMLSK